MDGPWEAVLHNPYKPRLSLKKIHPYALYSKTHNKNKLIKHNLRDQQLDQQKKCRTTYHPIYERLDLSQKIHHQLKASFRIIPKNSPQEGQSHFTLYWFGKLIGLWIQIAIKHNITRMPSKILFPNEKYTLIFHILHSDKGSCKMTSFMDFNINQTTTCQIIDKTPITLGLPLNGVPTKYIVVKFLGRIKYHPNHQNIHTKQTSWNHKSQISEYPTL